MFSHPGRTVVVILVWLLIVLKVPSSSRLADTPGSIIISKGFPITIYIVAGILVAFCFFDGWSCKRSCILHRRFQQFPRCHGTRFDPYMNKRYRFFPALDTGFSEKYMHCNFHIFVRICLPVLHNDSWTGDCECLRPTWPKRILVNSVLCFEFVDRIISVWCDNCHSRPLSVLFVENCTLCSWREIFV